MFIISPLLFKKRSHYPQPKHNGLFLKRILQG
ncbi:MAG: hypothetical protein ACJAWQ_002199, partial [Paraglaciecola sp.]